MPVRFRFVNPGGKITLPEVFGAHWQEEPWQNGSTVIGSNDLSQSMGGMFLDSSQALNLVVDRAGAPGDHLYRNFIASPGNYAQWGLFRVGPKADDVLVLTAYQRTTSEASSLTGYVTPDLRTGRYASDVRLIGRPDRAAVDQATGAFRFALADAPATVTVRSENGAQATAALPPAVAVPRVPRPPAPQVPPVASAPGGVGATHLERMQSKAAKYLPRPVNQQPAAP
jgi:hypothetical protein